MCTKIARGLLRSTPLFVRRLSRNDVPIRHCELKEWIARECEAIPGLRSSLSIGRGLPQSCFSLRSKTPSQGRCIAFVLCELKRWACGPCEAISRLQRAHFVVRGLLQSYFSLRSKTPSQGRYGATTWLIHSDTLKNLTICHARCPSIIDK